jgi:hypothetical protein
MNKTVVQDLLTKWITCVRQGKMRSKQKAHQQKPDGLSGRIKRTTGKPVIFDFKSLSDQNIIQGLLCKELPELSSLILSEPEIMDGYSWTRKDFIDLYFRHFEIVIEKIRRIAEQENSGNSRDETPV